MYWGNNTCYIMGRSQPGARGLKSPYLLMLLAFWRRSQRGGRGLKSEKQGRAAGRVNVAPSLGRAD